MKWIEKIMFIYILSRRIDSQTLTVSLKQFTNLTVPPPHVDGGEDLSRYKALFSIRIPGDPGPPTNL